MLPKGLQSTMSWVSVVILTGFGVYLLYKLQHIGGADEQFWHNIVKDQVPAMVGIPMAGLAALFMTLVLRAANGPVEFNALGMEFKGGSGPIVFWIICFITIVLSIKLLWHEPM
ncbi:MAG: hypothetical protein IPK70_15755 [Flavobacteriales bacterium]|nr:hypothetical protein [Flavobacteriales bacterium]